MLSCVVLLCHSVVLCCLTFLSKHLMDEYILGLVFGVFTSSITTAFYFILSWNSPVYLVCDALVEVLWLLCIVYMYVIRAQPAELVRALPRNQMVVGSFDK